MNDKWLKKNNVDDNGKKVNEMRNFFCYIVEPEKVQK